MTWDALNVNANQMIRLLKNTKRCLNHKVSASSYDMEGHVRKCVERYCELANKKAEQLFIRFPVLAWTITKKRKKEKLKNTGELAQVCSHIVLKCLYLARICRPDILWSGKDWQDLSQNGHTLVTHDWHG